MNSKSTLGAALLSVLTAAGAQADERVAEMERWLENRYAPGALVDVAVTASGRLFDCVDRDRQPGLRRPDGTFAPIAAPPRAARGARTAPPPAGERLAETEAVPCPAGSVPMVHVDLERLRRFGSLSAFFAKNPRNLAGPLKQVDGQGFAGSTALHQYAGVKQTVANWGGDAVFNLWNPFTARSNEFSLSQIGVTRGSGSDQQTLEAGWQEFEDLYGDWEPHLFIYSTRDGYNTTGCYNGSCGDFVQVAAAPVPGAGFTVFSTPGGPQYGIQLRWQRDDANDNWWLVYGTTWVGYYPGTLFDSAGVRNQASQVQYFGEIINDAPSGDHTATDMGSGGNPSSGSQQVAYTRTMRTISTSNVWQPASSAFEFRTDADCYDVELLSSAGAFGNYYYFGGEGYDSSVCE